MSRRPRDARGRFRSPGYSVGKIGAGKSVMIPGPVTAAFLEDAARPPEVEPFRDERSPYLRTEFLRGRTDFLAPSRSDGKHGHAPFGCVLVIFARPMYLEIERVGRKVIA